MPFNNPYQQQILGAEQQRKTAELLRNQAMQGPQGQMVSGRYVAPSITQYLAQGLRAYLGGKGIKEAESRKQEISAERQKALAQAIRGGNIMDVAQIDPQMAQVVSQQQQQQANEAFRQQQMAGNLVQAVDPQTGQPVYVQASKAAGMSPYVAPKKAGGDGEWKYDASSNQWVQPPSAEFPQGKRTADPEKAKSIKAVSYLTNRFLGGVDEKGEPTPGIIDKVMSGTVAGPLGSVFDRQDKREFENLREQLSTELRTVFRIPGEGALSDKEQAQYGVQLPSTDNSADLNKRILNDLNVRIGMRGSAAANPLGAGFGGQPAQQGTPATQVPQVGTVVDNYRFKGGNPADPNSWEKQ